MVTAWPARKAYFRLTALSIVLFMPLILLPTLEPRYVPHSKTLIILNGVGAVVLFSALILLLISLPFVWKAQGRCRLWALVMILVYFLVGLFMTAM